MNKVILIGRLTRDPDIRYTQGTEPMLSLIHIFTRPVTLYFFRACGRTAITTTSCSSGNLSRNLFISFTVISATPLKILPAPSHYSGICYTVHAPVSYTHLIIKRTKRTERTILLFVINYICLFDYLFISS